MGGSPEVPVRRAHARGGTAGGAPLAGRRVLVVGAGQMADPDPAAERVGIGRATSLLLAREGAVVVCVDRQAERAMATAAEVGAAGGQAVALVGDATDEDDVRRVLAEAERQVGTLDGLVLSVGVVGGGRLEETELAELMRVMEVNLGSQFLGLKHGLPALRRGGSVVMVSAIAAIRTGPTPLPYDASKAALAPLLRQAARRGEELGVRVNMVLPGAIGTPMAARAFGGPHPLDWGREGTPWEVASTIAFLLSEESSYVNAAELVVDGGLTALH